MFLTYLRIKDVFPTPKQIDADMLPEGPTKSILKIIGSSLIRIFIGKNL